MVACWDGTALKIPPSSAGCCSLLKQVILVTKNVHNPSGTDASHRFSNISASQLRLVSKGKDGFAEVLLPPPPSSSDCPMCLQGAASVQILQVSRGPLHSKAFKCWFKYWYYLKMSLVWCAFLPKDATRFVWFDATEAPSQRIIAPSLHSWTTFWPLLYSQDTVYAPVNTQHNLRSVLQCFVLRVFSVGVNPAACCRKPENSIC